MELRAAMKAVRRDELDLGIVLRKLANGAAVLESVEKMHREIEKDGVRADYAANLIVRHFELPRSALVLAFLKFAEEWHKKNTTETGTSAEFLEYLDYFVEARGSIALPRSPGDRVQLLTAHAAKGLEYRHVAVIRGSSTSFPCNYHEPLIAFPAELRTSGASLIPDKTLHEQEERRLFYVAMTHVPGTRLRFMRNRARARIPGQTNSCGS